MGSLDLATARGGSEDDVAVSVSLQQFKDAECKQSI